MQSMMIWQNDTDNAESSVRPDGSGGSASRIFGGLVIPSHSLESREPAVLVA